MTTQGSTPSPVEPTTSTALHHQEGSSPEAPSHSITDFTADFGAANLRETVHAYIAKVRGGEPGALPALLGLVVLVLTFGFTTKLFISVGNLANVPGQAAPTIIIAMGLVFVLLLGEIDLAAGTAAGACSGAMALAVNNNGNLAKVLHGGTFGAYVIFMAVALIVALWQRLWLGAAAVLFGLVILLTHLASNDVVSIALAVTTGTAIGVLTGILVARVGIPSFVVTLALFLTWQGVLLLFEGNGATVPTRGFAAINGIENKNLSPMWGWIVFVVSVVGYGTVTIFRSVRRRARNLSAEPLVLVLLRLVLLIVVGAFSVYFLNKNRGKGLVKIEGMPWIVPIVLVLLVVLTLLLTKTAFGRYLYAVGGNAEGSLRAGINVPRMRVSAFTISSSLAAFGGVALASYSGGVNSGAGGGNTLLFAVGAAVVGGTSLFGGRGRIRDAVLGGLVITLIPNGLGLHSNMSSAYNFVITGAFLLMAAAVDAASRRRSAV